MTITSGKHPPYVYLVNTNQGFLLGSNPSRVETGYAEPQIWLIQFATGLRAYGSVPAASNAGLAYDGVLLFSPNSTTTRTTSNLTKA